MIYRDISRELELWEKEKAGNRITFQNFGHSDYWSREMNETFIILEKTMLLRTVYLVIDTNLALAPGFKKKPFLHSLHQFADAAPHDWVVCFYSGKMAVEDAKTLAGKNIN